MNNKVVLAFSGGLDTSFCCIYLKEELGLEVYSLIVNTGGFSAEELAAVEAQAYKLGVKKHMAVDAADDYYNSCIKYMIYGNVLKNGTYPLSVSAERISQATAIANYALQVGADKVAHGSTGAGNDQVRFDMVFNTLIPGVEIITPIRDLKLSRQEEIAYLEKHGIVMNAAKAAYSINKGLWGTSVGGKETLNSREALPEEAWPTQVSKKEPELLSLSFTKGELSAVNGESYSNPVEAIQAVEAIGAPFGIGRDVHVGDTIIGIKGRVGFEAAAAVLIVKAHHLLEKHVLVKWQLYWKAQLAEFYGNWLHEGQLHDPAMRDIEAFLESTQQKVSGTVYIRLYPYRFVLEGIESPHDLMNNKFGSYGEMNAGYTGDDVKGFTKIFGNQAKIWHQVNAENND